MTITFSSPPINEVVVGKVFEPVQAFLMPHYGRFWELIQDEFPGCEHAAPVLDQSAEPPVDSFGLLLPRVWFSGEDKTRLIQVQSDRFYCNWRQTDGQQEYSRFDAIYAAYQKYMALFSTFVLSQLSTELITRRCELTYINVFRKGREWDSWEDLSRLFRHLKYAPQIEGGVLRGGNLQFVYEMPERSGRLTVSIASAKAAQTEDVIRMELTASSAPGLNADDEDAWFGKAHKAIVQSFCDLTTDDAQRSVWKRIS